MIKINLKKRETVYDLCRIVFGNLFNDVLLVMSEQEIRTFNFRRLAVVLFWIGFCFLLEEVGEKTDQFQNDAVYDARSRPKVIPGGMMPNFGGDYMVRLFYIDTEYFGEWKVILVFISVSILSSS